MSYNATSLRMPWAVGVEVFYRKDAPVLLLLHGFPNSSHMSRALSAFIEALEFKRYALYVFDCGAPIGLKRPIAQLEQIAGVVSHHGTAHEEGLGPAWARIREHWGSRNEESLASLRNLPTLDQVRDSYLDGMPPPAASALSFFVRAPC